ncbi:WXG100 family type VII secretion target [Lentzea sp. BCCO 10_0856]|uniref:WXG100 family type VII secretion target n=1 Tax=Lentzea miocenica TaxID=3095431 RepID=A0ABU4TFB8_9PSEU|nr:WXG100 family type VII secretion target [Lentzea sp. BCCO 10_0856]MDX8036885.1 WXG100 family type VII secretion target [Lentzea sp. BCCO 10_0856]
MAEQDYTAGSGDQQVKITVGEKTLGQKAEENAPIWGNFVKAKEAAGKTGDTGGVAGLTSEGSALVTSVVEFGQGMMMDPIGWLVGQGLNFLISVVQPLEDAIHFVSGDGPALQQAGENFGAIAQGISDLSTRFTEDLQSTVTTWGGSASEAAATKLGEFASGIDGVAGQAGELAELLMMSSMVMQIIEDVIKAILSELITWLIMIWIPALAAAVPSCGASTAAAGAATGVRIASTASRVSRIVAKLRQLLTKIMDFLRNLAAKAKNLGAGFKKAMADKKVRSQDATDALRGKTKWETFRSNPVTRMNSHEGMVGERMQQGFWKSMGDAVGNEALAQINYGHEKGARNASLKQQAAESRETGTDHSKQRIEGYLDL